MHPQTKSNIKRSLISSQHHFPIVSHSSSNPQYTHQYPPQKTDSTGTTRVLLCRRAIEPRVGKWGFPQGFMELGEGTRDGAARETKVSISQ